MGLLRALFSLLNSPQVIERLAESRPIRRAAQITAYALIRARMAGQDALRSHTLRQVRQEAARGAQDPGGMSSRLGRIRDAFIKEVKDGLTEGSRQIKK